MLIDRSRQCGRTAAGTFNGAPLGLPSQDPLAIDLILMVTAHHSKWDHLLEKAEELAAHTPGP